ncbi:hypothetical protein BJX70DRAFT_331535 [Aspergillus crustosus]
MAHAITLSSAAMRRPAIISSSTNPRNGYTISRESKISSQTRSLWGCSHQRYIPDRNFNHIRFIISKHHRLRRPHHSPREQTIYPNYDTASWRNNDWSGSSLKPGFPEAHPRSRDRGRNKGGGGDKIWPGYKYWEAHKDRAQQRVVWVKKEIETDPFTALFGRRLEPFHFGSGFKLENRFTELFKSLLGLSRESSKRADTTVNVKVHNIDKAEPRNARVHEARDSEKQEVLSQSSSDARDAGFEFDPISGRMVPRAPGPLEVLEKEHKERWTADGIIAEQKSESEGPDQPTTVEKAETNSLDSHVIDGLNQQNPATAETPIQPDGTSPSTTANQRQVPNAPDFISEWLESSPAALSAESIRAGEQTQPLPHVKHDEHGEPPRNHTIQLAQHSIPENSVIPEELVCGIGASKEDLNRLDRVGFLSRRDEESPSSTAQSYLQNQAMAGNRIEDLEALRASDIREAYDARRLSIASEIEAEKSRYTSPVAALYASSAPKFDSHAEAPEGQSDTPSNESMKASIATTTSHSEDQLPAENIAQHKRSADANESVPNSPSTPKVYRIFAYDLSTLQVREAETISSLQVSKEQLHAADVLTRLEVPAKFLPCLNHMRAEGYEIVSGGGDILVFRKAPTSDISAASHLHGNQSELGDSIYEGHSVEGANLQQPVHNDFYTRNLPEQRSYADQFHSKNPPISKVRSILRRMFIGGAATAGTCIALSIVGEYFRTGGADGRGIDGFTAFESDRRHRE